MKKTKPSGGPILCRYKHYGGKIEAWFGIRCTSCRAETDIKPERLGFYSPILKVFKPICENCEHKFI